MANGIDNLEPPFTPSELAEFLHIKTHVLDQLRERGEGPGYLVLRGSRGMGQIRYPRESVRRWLNSAGSAYLEAKPTASSPAGGGQMRRNKKRAPAACAGQTFTASAPDQA